MQGIALLLSAIGILASAGVAWFTYRLASSTKRLAEETKSAVDVERDALERTKDGLMPVLRFRSIQLQEGDPTRGTPDRYTLVVENIGDGAAFMRDVTVRDEVGLSDLFNSELRTAVIGKGQTVEFVIGGTNQFRHFEVDEVSSWSLWYNDIYGRWFRSRAVVMYSADKHHSQVLAFEFIKDVPPTTISYGTRQAMRPPNYVTLFELGVVHPLGQADRRLYTLHARDTIVGLKFRHEAVKDGAEFIVTDFGFWLRERLPTFEVQVSDRKPFTIGMVLEDNNYHVVLEPAESFTAKKTGLAYVPASRIDQLPLSDWGLNDSNTGLENRLSGLYNLLLHAVTELVGFLAK